MRIKWLFRGIPRAPRKTASRIVACCLLVKKWLSLTLIFFCKLHAPNRFERTAFHVCSFHGARSGRRWRRHEDGVCVDGSRRRDYCPLLFRAIESLPRGSGASHPGNRESGGVLLARSACGTK